MRALLVAFLCLTATGADAAERRCGWYINPTPGNLILQDRDGAWWITSQGGPGAVGVEENAPEFDEKQYVATQPNGYGYGCACMTVATDAAAMQITQVFAGDILPLSKCQADPSLPKPEM
ncbi:MAG: DUF4087 domain-containing protein [Cereibacter sphaeroides]|uniref:DUF4087 domain-containing protein n=1 Tax=Cereibacter sphaeroides TaxID=1063 RepID=A0A2W5SBZ8_CERSP|nr:MAG: DUF4087 domain-containing protein [Cereibacter sphaeroides]